MQKSALYKTSDIIEAVDSHPHRWQEIPLETALSLPVPLINTEQPSLGFFIYSVGGPITHRVIGPPTHRVVASLQNLEHIQFVHVTASEMGFAADTTLETIVPEPRGEGAESYDNLVKQLCVALDQLVQVYANTPELLEKQTAQDYQRLLSRLEKRSLLPAYHALNPHFFKWLESVKEKD
jgi:hypothetical protein